MTTDAIEIALQLQRAGKLSDAEGIIRGVLRLNQSDPRAWNALGNVLAAQRKLQDAANSWQRAIEIDPDCVDAYASLGTLLAENQQPSKAAELLRYALHLNPRLPHVHNNLANVLLAMNEQDSAITHWRQAIELAPRYLDALVNLGKALMDRGDFELALQSFDQALEVKPDLPDARFLRAIVLLSKGDLAAGFADYEWRWKASSLRLRPMAFALPRWDGSDPRGKTIFLWSEQGLGDTIQFIRYATLLAERGATVIVGCNPSIAALLATVPGVTRVVTQPPWPPFDCHASLLSLPTLFKTTNQNVPATVPYITANPALVQSWKSRLHPTTKKRIGLAWAGNPKHTNDQRRSMSLTDLAPLAQLDHCRFYSLQKGPAADQLRTAPTGLHIIDYSSDFTDFSQTAALIANLDLVLTVDTSIAHVSGALAKTTWVLLPHVAEWRYQLQRSDSPWYPTMKLFRQARPRDWTFPVHEVAVALTAQQ